MWEILPGTTNNADPLSAFPLAGDTGVASGRGTGQHGITPIIQPETSMGSTIQSVWDWLNKPFNEPLSPAGITLIVGAIIVAVILWNMVLYHIRIAAETI